MTNNTSAHLIISGRVQGVFFRFETQRTAQRFNVAGWVRNLPDGTVEALLEGPADAVDQTIAWCRRGPSRARVDDVRVAWQEYKGDMQGFVIL